MKLVKLIANSALLWDGAPVQGSTQHCPPGTGEMIYAIEATGDGGTSRSQQAIQVVEVQPTPTWTPLPPTPEP